MKTIITMLTVTGFLLSTTAFAAVKPVKQNDQLKERIELMLTELETTQNSPAIEKLILTNIVTAYSNSNIKNPVLKERLANALIRIKPALSKKEEAIIDKRIAKIK